MKKIISLFERNYDGDRLVRNEIVPGAEWVVAGEGVATQKLDGTCCRVKGGRLYKRQEIQMYVDHTVDGRPVYASKKDIHEDYEEEAFDETTLKSFGWVPVGDGPEDRWHREAWDSFPVPRTVVFDGTYELLGPKIQGNPERFDRHVLVRHGFIGLPKAPRDFEGLKAYLASQDIEGIVWHHPDGRMVKIKSKDFGIKRDKKNH